MITQRERPLNIKDLIIGEPTKTDFRFDPVERLSWEDLNKIFDLVSSEATDRIYWNSSKTHLIWKARLLFPNLYEEVDLKPMFEKVFKPSSQIDSVTQRIEFFADFKFLSPQNFKISESTLEDLRGFIRALTSRSEFSYLILDELATHKLTFPNSELPTDQAEDVLFSKCIATANSFKDDHTKPFKSAIRCFANMRILFPSRYSQFGLDESFWERADEEIQYYLTHEKYQDGSVDKLRDLIVMVYDLKILEAKDIILTDSGIELVPADVSLQKEVISPLPEARRF